MTFDAVVVGAGFAGAVMAERLANEDGMRVLVVERRSHIGGNAYDEYDEAGILVHRYGPHIFHCNSAEIFSYLSRFTTWRPYEHRVRAMVGGRALPFPINLDTINQLYGLHLTSAELADWFAAVAEPRGRLVTSEDVVVSKIGRDLYETFFRGYTRKQWGLDPSELDAQVTARVPIRTDRDDRYFTDRYQVMPRDGYTRLFERLLGHPRISVTLNTNWQESAPHFGEQPPLLIWTGPVDAFFDYCFGPLPYRSLEFRFETRDLEWAQEVGTINYPNGEAFTRVTEMKHLTGQRHTKTTLVYEYPQATGEPYYPIPRPESTAIYRRYAALAAQTPGVTFVGRLATYRYYDMDQVVAQALATHKRLSAARRLVVG
jgi:UDP-galactopyranose mutase